MTDTSNELSETQVITPQYLTPPHYVVDQEGVVLINNVKDSARPILDIPLWCSRKSDVAATFEWVAFGQHRKSIMLLDTLNTLKETIKWLLTRGVIGFASNPNQLEAVKRYMLACVQMFDKDFVIDTVDISKAAPRAVSTLAAGFIDYYSQHVAELLIDQRRWTIPYVEQLLCLGRTQRESTIGYNFAPNWSLAVRPQAFTDYAATLGFLRRDLKRLLSFSHVRDRQLALCRDHTATVHVWIIPLLAPDYVQRGAGAVPYGLARWTGVQGE